MLRVNLKQREADKVLLDDAASYASLSPDGTKVLFVREGERWWRKGYRGERAGQIWLLDLPTGQTKELLHEGTECLWPMWMPDASGFYFTKGQPKGFELWSYKFPKKEGKAAKQKRVAGFDEDSIVRPCISRDGSTIVFRHLFDLYSWKTDSEDPPRKLSVTINSDVGLREDKVTSTLTRADDVPSRTMVWRLHLPPVVTCGLWIQNSVSRFKSRLQMVMKRDLSLPATVNPFTSPEPSMDKSICGKFAAKKKTSSGGNKKRFRKRG